MTLKCGALSDMILSGFRLAMNLLSTAKNSSGVIFSRSSKWITCVAMQVNKQAHALTNSFPCLYKVVQDNPIQ